MSIWKDFNLTEGQDGPPTSAIHNHDADVG